MSQGSDIIWRVIAGEVEARRQPGGILVGSDAGPEKVADVIPLDVQEAVASHVAETAIGIPAKRPLPVAVPPLVPILVVPDEVLAVFLYVMPQVTLRSIWDTLVNGVAQAREDWYANSRAHAHFEALEHGCLDLLADGIHLSSNAVKHAPGQLLLQMGPDADLRRALLGGREEALYQ